MKALRLRATILAPAICATAMVATSPLGAELALAHGDGAARAAPLAGLVYGGMTSDGWPAVIEVTRNGRLIRSAVAAIDADCSAGGSLTIPSGWRYLRVAKNGRFKGSYDNSYLDDGTEVIVAETLAGRFNRKRTRLTASWRVSTTFRNPDGTTDTCDSGSVKVTARQ